MTTTLHHLRFTPALLLLLGCKDGAVQARPQIMDKANMQWSQPVNGLRLGVSGSSGFAELSLENVGTQPLTVLSHVNAGESHLDWFTLHLRDSKGAKRDLRMVADRNKAGQVKVTLEPGKSLQHRVDIQRWAARPTNGNAPFATGSYELRATYEVEPGEPVWSGKLEAGTATLTIAK
jgi:hypothetical protein